jgi:hypothetical protein
MPLGARVGRHSLLVGILCVGGQCSEGQRTAAPPSDAGAGDGGSMDRDGATVAQAFHFDLEVAYGAQTVGDFRDSDFPRQVSFSGLLDEDAGQPRLRVGGHGFLATIRLQRAAGTRLTYQEGDPAAADGHRATLAIVVPAAAGGGCKFVDRINITALTLDGTGDQLVGTAEGFATFQDGDSIGLRHFVASLRASVDRLAPAPPVAPKDVNPFDAVSLGFAEALAVSHAELRSAELAAPIDLANLPESLPSAFSSQGRLLPFGKTLTFAALPAPADLGGNAITDSIEVTTAAAPPLFVADGFEGTVAATIAGDVAVISSADVPGVAGSKALLIGPGTWSDARAAFSGGRFTARLALARPASAATRIRARLIFLSEANGSVSALTVRLAAAPGGAITEIQGPTASLEMIATKLARFPVASPVISFEAPLPADTSDTVYLDVENLARGCGAILPPGALVIDDLRIE